MARGLVLAAACILSFAACSSKTVTLLPASSASTSASPTVSANITVHGNVEVAYGESRDSMSCAVKIGQGNPVSVGFKDASGTLLATQQVTLLAGDVPFLGPGSCSGLRMYRVTVSQQDLYQVEVNGKPAGSVSLSDLQASDYTFDVSV
jgi:hypothetical protein